MGERTVMGTTGVSVLTRRIQELEKENARLKAILDKNGIEYESFESKTCETNHLGATAVSTYQLTLQEKVALFQSLFQGREDVFARRWYSSSTQKSGYQPVCTREWNREFCDKRKYKCADCPNRQFAPLAYNDFFNHLAGKDAWGRDVIGLYPIRKDNTCCFLCTDFDDKSCEHGYKNDVLAFVNVCKTWNVPCYIERSRSSNGAHAWIFFDTPVTAFKARKLGNAILTEAMSCDAHLSFKSYDRFFPNQDTLPEGGLGNLVALPLQGIARRKGNSVFVDEDFNAYADQWEMLSQIHKLSEVELDLLLQQHAVPTLGELSKTCEEKPWETPHMDAVQFEDYPKQIVLTRVNMLYVPFANLSAKCVNVFKRIAAFRNPEFYEKQGMRLSTYNIPRIISCSEMTDDYLALPRGCEDAVCCILTQHGVKVVISDKTNHGHNINVTFRVGCLYAGKNTLHGIIDIALIQSCLSDGEAKPFVKDYGMVIVDECHHVSSVSFEQVLRQVTATYVYGLTATPVRKDGHQPIIFMQCGKIRFTADAKSQMENQTFKRLLIPRFTSFRNISSDSKTYVQVTQDLSEDKVRNEFIVEDVRIAIQEGRTPLVLTTRTAHVKALAQMLIPFADHVIQLIGADSAKEKRLALQNLQSMPTSESLVIVATGKYVGEGFDYPRLDTLFLTMPIA